MSLATSNRDGGRTSESGHLRGVTKGTKGQILSGLNVSQRGAGANLSVDIAIGDAVIQRSDNTYGHPAWNDAVLNQVIATADVSNPRRDIIVMYIDYATTPSTGVSNNTNGVVKVKSVAGTPAGSPADPSDSAIQASVGSGNPFVKLARVRVAAGATSITNSVIDDLRLMATSLPQDGFIYDSVYPWVYASPSSFTIAGADVRSQFPVGTILALYQSGAIKYFRVSSTSFSTNTTVNIDGGGTYTLANVPIDRPAFSYDANPGGFPYQVIQNKNAGYEELANVTLSGNATSLVTPTFSPRRALRIIIIERLAGVATEFLRFNADAGNNYVRGVSEDGGTPTYAVNQSGVQLGGSLTQKWAAFDVQNVAAYEKLLTGILLYQNGSGAGTAPILGGFAAKWVNGASQISQVGLYTTGANMSAGTQIIVLGKD